MSSKVIVLGRKQQLMREKVEFVVENKWTMLIREIEDARNWVCRTKEIEGLDTLICWICEHAHETLYTLQEALGNPPCRKCVRRGKR